MNFKGRPFKIIIYNQADEYELMGHKTIVDEIYQGLFKNHKHVVREIITRECDIVPVTGENSWITDEQVQDGQKVTLKVEATFCPDCGHVPYRFYSKDAVYCGRCLKCMGKYLSVEHKKNKKVIEK